MLPPDTPPLTISEALARAVRRLAPMEDRRLDAEVLLASVLGKPRTHLIAWPDKLLSQAQQKTFDRLVERRLSGEPAAHLTGEREFWSLKLRVTEDTLIPRPETETLVQRALELIPEDTAWIIADLGTGSGAIAAAIASGRPRCRLIATDISGAALEVAAENFRNLGLFSVDIFQGDWFGALPEAILLDMILSNPPYVAEGDPHLERNGLPFEPDRALMSGPEGLDAARHLAEGAPGYLKPGGWLMLEHGFDQGEPVRRLMRQAGLSDIQTQQDPGGRDRITEGRNPD